MIKKILNFILVFSLLVVVNIIPLVSLAHDGYYDEAFDPDSLSGPLVPCGAETSKVETEKDASGKLIQKGGVVMHPCKFAHIFLLLNKIISFVFKVMVVPIAAIMFCYAGFLMLFSGGNAGKSEKAKGIFIDVFFGLVIAAGAWLIIHEVLKIVGIKAHINTFGL